MLLNLKEINISDKPNIGLKNSTHWDANLLAMFKHDRGVELGAVEKQPQLSGQREPHDLRISSPVP